MRTNMNVRKITITALLLVLVQVTLFAQKKGVTSVSASVNAHQGTFLLDNNSQTAWELESKDLPNNQFLMFTLLNPGDVKEIQLEAKGISKEEIQKAVSVFITYDPMNLGEAVKYNIRGNQKFTLTFSPKYGAHVQIAIKGNTLKNPVYNKKRAVVKVKNTGNIMDTGKAQLFVNGAQTGEVHHYELNAGEEKTITFDLDRNGKINELTFAIKYKSVTIKPN
jgi:beta-glucosidase